VVERRQIMIMRCDPQREGTDEESEAGILGEGGHAGDVFWL
jgi:hypothetical protein